MSRDDAKSSKRADSTPRRDPLAAPHAQLVELMFMDAGEFADHVRAIERKARAPDAAEVDADLWRELLRETFQRGPNRLSYEQAVELTQRQGKHLSLLRAMIDGAKDVPVPWVDALGRLSA